MDDISGLQKEAKLILEMPKRLSESVANCKDIYGDVLSIMQVKSVSYLHLSTLYEVRLSNDV